MLYCLRALISQVDGLPAFVSVGALARALFILLPDPVCRLHDFPVTFHELRAVQLQPLFLGFHEVRKVFLCHPIIADLCDCEPPAAGLSGVLPCSSIPSAISIGVLPTVSPALCGIGAAGAL